MDFKKMQKDLKGFTLIELIIVIVLLGILSAVALPRFLDLSSDAHNAAVQHAATEFLNGIQLMHSQRLVSQTTSVYGAGAFNDLYFDGLSNPYSYPNGYFVKPGVIGYFTNSPAACVGLWNTVLDASTVIIATTSTVTPAPDFVAYPNKAGQGGCAFGYRGNVLPGQQPTKYIWYNMTNGAVSITSTAPTL